MGSIRKTFLSSRGKEGMLEGSVTQVWSSFIKGRRSHLRNTRACSSFVDALTSLRPNMALSVTDVHVPAIRHVITRLRRVLT